MICYYYSINCVLLYPFFFYLYNQKYFRNKLNMCLIFIRIYIPNYKHNKIYIKTKINKKVYVNIRRERKN